MKHQILYLKLAKTISINLFILLLTVNASAQNPLIMDQFTADPTARGFNGKLRYSEKSNIGAASVFLDRLDPFEGWKVVLNKPGAWVRFNELLKSGDGVEVDWVQFEK